VVNKESLKRYLNKSYQILESRLEQEQQSCSSDEHPKSGAANSNAPGALMRALRGMVSWFHT
jgi:hypothetical protein